MAQVTAAGTRLVMATCDGLTIAKTAGAKLGINDAPALAQAEIGIAMSTGTDVAINSAQVTLVKSDLPGIATARGLSNATIRNMKQNLAFAFVYNALGVPLAAGIHRLAAVTDDCGTRDELKFGFRDYQCTAFAGHCVCGALRFDDQLRQAHRFQVAN